MSNNSFHDQYKNLEKTDIETIPDTPSNLLEEAVFFWMCSKFDSTFSNQLEVISSLPKPCQNVYSCQIVFHEVLNGGFDQLFFNSSRQFIEMSIGGFAALGSQKLSDVMTKAVEVYLANKQEIDTYIDDWQDGCSKLYEKRFFDALEELFVEEYDSVNFSQYIRLHAADFGD